MVSARPPPNPARGRISYPSATAYAPGDASHSPAYLRGSEPVHPTTSRDSDKERAQGLKTWWRTFRDRPEASSTQHVGVFGVPLAVSIRYASVQISTAGKDGALYVWGTVPVVVAKCGLYLKENATEVEGTFRISGSSKRMRDLQAIFDTGPKYGKNIDWSALPFTSHDVATIFRRFLTQMPEPIVPYSDYQAFREALDPDNIEGSRTAYKSLVHSLPPPNRYLLLYVLDLLHVFTKKADKNLMNAANLALIFQPGMLSHPEHAMHPREHVLSQQVLEFLIEQQDCFLMDLQPGSGPSKTRKTTPPQSTMVRVGADLIEPSDSDDEAPSGGYFLVEAPARISAPKWVDREPVVQDSTTLHQSMTSPRHMTSPQMSSADIEPSDSDEEAPPGGYAVHQGDPAKRQAELLAKTTHTASSNTNSSLARRRTVPARLWRQKQGRARSNTKEAP